MKRLCVVFLAVLLSAPAFAQLTDFTIDFSITVPLGTVDSLAVNALTMGSYNWTTDHIIWSDFVNDRLIVTNNDGTNPVAMNMTGINPLNLTVFANACAPDGAIFAGSEIGGSKANVSLIYWANESAAPIEVENTGAEFPRAMRVIKEGSTYRIGVCGSNDYDATVHTTTDGTSYTFIEDVGTVGDVNSALKQGLDWGLTGDLLYGVKGDGGYTMSKFTRQAGVMTLDTTYNPTESTLGNPAIVGYGPNYSVVFCVGVAASPNHEVHMLDGDTGASIANHPINQSIGPITNAAYGAIYVNEAVGQAWLLARSPTAGSVVIAKISFTPFFIPTPTVTPVPPTPTTYSEYWQLYR